MHVIARGALVAALVAFVATPALAQDEYVPVQDGVCGALSICGGDAGHVNPHSAGTTSNYAHGDCAACNRGNGTMWECHPNCSEPLAAAGVVLRASVKLAYRDALQAAHSGDVAALLRAGKAADGFVTYNATRNAVQLIACDGRQIAASLPVKTSAELAIARALPDPAQVLTSLATVIEQAKSIQRADGVGARATR